MVVVMVGGEGVGEEAAVVVEATGSPDGEEGGDGPGSLVGEVTVAVVYKQTLKKHY